MKMKCNACRNEVNKLDERKLCKHCGWKFDHIDAIACDLRSIREEMTQFGVPLGKKDQSYHKGEND